MRHAAASTLATLVLASGLLAGCADPAGPPVPADGLELALTSIFDQVWGQPASGWVDMAVVLEATVPAADTARIAALAVTWPIRAVVLDIPTTFAPGADGRLRASRRVPRDDGLGKGEYFLDVAFQDGQTLRLAVPHGAPTLLAPQVIELSRTDAQLTFRWRTPPQSHTWTLRLRRAGDDTVIEEVDRRAGTVREIIQVGLDLQDPAAAYELEMEMVSPSNVRRIIFPVPAP